MVAQILITTVRKVNDNFLPTYQNQKPPWRNWLARSAVNRKVGGSSPPGGAYNFDNLTPYYTDCIDCTM